MSPGIPGDVSDPLRGRGATTISCAAPTKVLGTAGWIQSSQPLVPAGHHFIDVLRPNSGLKSVSMTAYDGVGVNRALFDVRPIALCGVPPNVPWDPVP